MLDIGWSELLVICVVAMVVIGPDKMPEVARGVAKVVRQLRRMINDFKNSIDLEELVNPSPPPPPPPPAARAEPASPPPPASEPSQNG